MPLRSVRFRVAAILGATLVAGPVRADLVFFVEGTKGQMPASLTADRIRIETPEGPRDYPRSDLLKHVPGFCPEREWLEKKSEALKGKVQVRLEAASWAIGHGLVAEAESMYRAAREADPTNPTANRLGSLVDRLEADSPDPDLAPIRRGFPADVRIARGPHVLLFHQHSDREAQGRVDLLEKVYKSFFYAFAELGIDLEPPRDRLPSIWFARKDDYLAALNEQGATAFLTTRGFHSPTRGLVLAYDCRSDPKRIEAQDVLRRNRAELDRLAAQIQAMPRGGRIRLGLNGQPPRPLGRDEARRDLDAMLRRLDRQSLFMAIEAREIDGAVAAHETVHQLVARSGLSPRADAFPTWLNEGLAMQFESFRGGTWAGPEAPCGFRLRDFRVIQPEPRLAPILSDDGLNRGYRQDAYARAWSLVYVLRSQAPQTFVALLDHLRNPGSTRGQTPQERARNALLDDFDGGARRPGGPMEASPPGARRPPRHPASPAASGLTAGLASV